MELSFKNTHIDTIAYKGNEFSGHPSDEPSLGLDGFFPVINFSTENIEYLLNKQLAWPIKAVVVSKSNERILVVKDARIPPEYYRELFYQWFKPSELIFTAWYIKTWLKPSF